MPLAGSRWRSGLTPRPCSHCPPWAPPARPAWPHGAGDEEEVVVMGGDGFTPEQVAEAERQFEERLGINLGGASCSLFECMC